jgi:hypothetical protein
MESRRLLPAEVGITVFVQPLGSRHRTDAPRGSRAGLSGYAHRRSLAALRASAMTRRCGFSISKRRCGRVSGDAPSHGREAASFEFTFTLVGLEDGCDQEVTQPSLVVVRAEVRSLDLEHVELWHGQCP